MEVGDKVWAKDMVTGKKRLRTVKAVSSHVDTRMMTLVVGGERIRVTTEHPFHTSQGWVRSGDLKAGDRVSLIDGGTAAVTSITYDAKPTRVYNFEVEGDHNYAVTETGVLVHNSSCGAGSVRYGELDDLDRPTGMSATLTPDMVGTGTRAKQAISPAGFGGRSAGHARGHLLGKRLGGDGGDARNLMTLYQNPVNNPAMRGFENQVRSALDAGETVSYAVTPIYRGSELMPIGVTMSAQSESLDFYVSIVNRR
ncbi:hypothetical protein G5V59_09740 [Nocardioides sp. W3-2-3]|uniref:DNA/RNA non-specific endonuclease n=1 Tax=Nocardioides convexus TaxID=2712224 RepID=UPI0024187A89|nr:DNA/RNA non-specific endonuclease [Nocardioides convexus]NHA00290.1 hypothetical protein [Nocardioides convexus]